MNGAFVKFVLAAAVALLVANVQVQWKGNERLARLEERIESLGRLVDHRFGDITQRIGRLEARRRRVPP
jgi:hypothetical protein